MLNLMKYELRKNKAVLVTLILIVLGLEGYFLAAYAQEEIDHMGVAASFLTLIAMISFVVVFIIGIVNYQKELSSKTSYMVFMTPNSSLKIIASKLCYILLLGVVTAVVLGGLALIDLNMVGIMVDEEYHVFELAEYLAEYLGINLSSIMGYIVLEVINVIVSVLSVVTIAYLAITLSATILYNSRFRGIISVVFFIMLMLAVNYVNNKFINDNPASAFEFAEIVKNSLPGIIYNAIIMVGCMFGCSALIDRQISL